MPEINWKLDVGHIITILALLIGGAVGWGAVNQKMEEHTRALQDMRTELTLIHEKVDAISIQQAVTATQLQERERLADEKQSS